MVTPSADRVIAVAGPAEMDGGAQLGGRLSAGPPAPPESCDSRAAPAVPSKVRGPPAERIPTASAPTEMRSRSLERAADLLDVVVDGLAVGAFDEGAPWPRARRRQVLATTSTRWASPSNPVCPQRR
ncbi:hypothetical protein [Nocardia xishanensis]|uniref:Uncharacterized protein n=1 Tax=Nocardia xishanensis TaxID=238964 RepID=A0ABW7X4X8_9NOCA